VSRKAEKTLDELITLLDKNQANFQKTMSAIEQSSAELQALVKRSNELDLPGTLATTLTTANQMCQALTATIAKVEEGKIVENLAATAANFKNFSEAADSVAVKEMITQAKQSVDNLAALTLEVHDSWGHVDDAAQSLSHTMKQCDALIASVAEGKGTLGKFLNSDDIYLKAQGILAKVDTSIADVNNYGMLFHLDKSWQRERRKRILELEQLQTASQFKSFLDRELSQITTSVSRVGIALDKADTALAATDNMPNKALAKREFMSSYNELLGQLQQLENTLKTYGGEHIAESDSVLLNP
jgi:phospholipid/cholesterol/gamma-HCH transport system substrate-binding protein